jgi:hypothetical protein
VPITLVIIFVLLYLNFGRLTETLIVMLSVPFALVGDVWLMDFMQFKMSVGVAVGFIALAGVGAETGVVMLIYIDQRPKLNPMRLIAVARPIQLPKKNRRNDAFALGRRSAVIGCGAAWCWTSWRSRRWRCAERVLRRSSCHRQARHKAVTVRAAMVMACSIRATSGTRTSKAASPRAMVRRTR